MIICHKKKIKKNVVINAIKVSLRDEAFKIEKSLQSPH